MMWRRRRKKLSRFEDGGGGSGGLALGESALPPPPPPPLSGLRVDRGRFRGVMRCGNYERQLLLTHFGFAFP